MAQLQFAKYHHMLLSTSATNSSSELMSENCLEYSCTVIEKQTVSTKRSFQHASKSNDDNNAVRIDKCDSTIISINTPDPPTKPIQPAKRERPNSVNFGTMTITALPMASTMRVTRTIDLTNNDLGNFVYD